MRYAAVVGRPIGHSKSPVLHRAAYELLGADIQYSAIELAEAQAPEHAARLRGGDWVGTSVTMPLKSVFVPLMDEVSPRVRRLGALNTIVARDGRLLGENTDVDGLVHALAGRSADRAAILGAGNTALAAVEACALLGTEELTLIVRDASRSTRAVQLAEELGLRVRTVGIEEAEGIQADVTFSTLPPRAADGWAPRLSSVGGTLLDVAYDPWPSQLALAWGGEVISGLHMLVHQAVEQVRLFTGIELDPERRNLVTNAMYDSLGLHREG